MSISLATLKTVRSKLMQEAEEVSTLKLSLQAACDEERNLLAELAGLGQKEAEQLQHWIGTGRQGGHRSIFGGMRRYKNRERLSARSGAKTADSRGRAPDKAEVDRRRQRSPYVVTKHQSYSYYHTRDRHDVIDGRTAYFRCICRLTMGFVEP